MSSNPSQASVPEIIPGQLSLRAYFVAHAPAVPAWFEPQMPAVIFPNALPGGSHLAALVRAAVDDMLDQEQVAAATKDWREEDIEAVTTYLEKYHAASDLRVANHENRDRERVLQWPLFWADSMIERLAR